MKNKSDYNERYETQEDVTQDMPQWLPNSSLKFYNNYVASELVCILEREGENVLIQELSRRKNNVA